MDPVAFTIGSVSVHWYGISYGLALLLGIWILIWLNKRQKAFKDDQQIYDLVFWLFLAGVILGGRLGYVLFYNPAYYFSHPLKIFFIWEGGMSFHGGLILSIAIAYFFCKKQKIDFLKMADIAVIPGAFALIFTRIANFINGELIGRAINNSLFNWMGVDFGDGVLRYPSQLFQSASALLLFIILLTLFLKYKPKKGVLFFSYIALYGIFRFITEFWRMPDEQIGFILNYFTVGQILCAVMMGIGVWGLFNARRAKI